ncbi:MAG: 2-oxo acid dehydrogenase subunit E2 [Actinomycetales bacterium]|nr:2-oxo acid dehydrogenase subunit E2 [Actinomycetales bacterium]
MSERVFLLPDVGEGLVEADIVEWKVAVGDVVSLNQPLVDIETAKAVVELPSPYAGTVTILHANVGDTVEVDRPLITFNVADAEGDEPAASTNVGAGAPPEVETPEKRTSVLVGYGVANEDATPTRRHRRQGSTPSAPPAPAAPAATLVAPSASPRSTPPVRLYAKQHGVDLTRVAGTGRDGLITRADVDALLGAPAPTAGAPATTSRFIGRDLEPWDSGPAEERIAVKGVLKTMSEAMTQSAFSAPHAVVWLRVDATKTVELLASLKGRPSLEGIRLSPLTIAALAVCDAARTYPGINSSFDAAASEVVVRRSVNLGIAANTPRGLIVPNVKAADRLDLVAMAQALNALVDRARDNTTTPAEMAGTTLTITNVGPFGVDGAMPILPPGTGAILAVGQLAKAPWVVDDQVVVRHVVELSMSFDHRQIDGALASQFIAHVGAFLSDPAPRLIAG